MHYLVSPRVGDIKFTYLPPFVCFQANGGHLRGVRAAGAAGGGFPEGGAGAALRRRGRPSPELPAGAPPAVLQLLSGHGTVPQLCATCHPEPCG